jgi:Transcriptional regulator
MELRHLRYLVAVAEQGSFSGAARRLHVAQSAISEQLSNLESEIGVPLFARSSKNATLTREGCSFSMRPAVSSLPRTIAVQVAHRAHRGEIGTLRIGLFAGAMGVSFPKLIRSFRKQQPHVQLSRRDDLHPSMGSAGKR